MNHSDRQSPVHGAGSPDGLEASRVAAQFRRLVDHLPGILYQCANEPTWPMTSLTGTVEQLTGHSASDFLDGRVTWGDLIHAEDRQRVWRSVQSAIENNEAFQLRYRIYHRNGDVRVVLEQGSALVGDGAKPSIEGFIWDITRESELEERLRQAQKMEALGQFTGGIAHDFNNILCVIVGSAELALADPGLVSQPPREHLDRILQASSRATSLIQKLLGYSRRADLQVASLDLGAVVREVVPTLERLLPETIEVSLEMARQSVLTLADPNAIEQIVFNLATNARDAMPAGGQLMLKVREVAVTEQMADSLPWTGAGTHALLTVRDTGCGIPPHMIPRVIEPFVTTKPAGKGTGLGLAMVYGLIKQLGGSIYVSSDGQTGTEVAIYLPLATEGAVAHRAEETAPHRDLRAVGGETILVVEDDEALRDTARRALNSFGYHVLTAADGGEALKQVERYDGEIDLVFSDLVVPRLWGRQLYDEVRQRVPTVGFLFASGYVSPEAAHEFPIPEQAAYLAKPWTIEQLGAKVREVLDRAA